ncbi:PLD nuclease N-terminal domain-containing protein [Sanguibacter suaedae]|uniref:PLDc_N domain-containing protein n=1 Tax=Sanguibacter suaedae TaxID=2795737 RepID=A0A934I9Q5_9MICO|nr:PLD nuclease N-terminal domain-containing protein [Sanguibacter suaedae]MBI9113948.1 PLDc_N domain-containing protein [Sanguibacter suaedae]
MLRVLAVLTAFALLVYAFSDFATSDSRDRGDIPRWLWLVIIVLLPYFGPIAWIVFSRSRRAQAAGGTATGPARRGMPGAGRARRRPSGPVAPDDDPDFLWRLEREQRRNGTPGATGAKPGATGPADPSTPPDDTAGTTGDQDDPEDDDPRRDGAPGRGDGAPPV